MKRMIAVVVVLVLALGEISLGDPGQRSGLLEKSEDAWPGYTLMAPIALTTTYLLDMDGTVVHTWESDAPAGNAVYLLDNGNLLRTEQVLPEGERRFDQGGAGGRVREIAPDGTVVWEYTLSDTQRRLHHDVAALPNGNILMIAWEAVSRAEAIAAGRDPLLLKDDELWADIVIEVRPEPPSGGEIVWIWRVWDHLVQDFDPTKEYFGDVAAEPGLVDLNYAHQGGGKDWNHTNSIAYNAQLDQIALSVHEFGEVWIIDHSTTTCEAAQHSGGRSGRGGDLLYRWGNPRAHRAGDLSDQVWFGQHDVHWIEAGLPGAGHLLAFNNGLGRPERTRPYSTVDEVAVPVLTDGSYAQPETGVPYVPAEPAWQYRGPGLYSANISGAQRLSNGNTLICEGGSGRILEVTATGARAWEYVNPFGKPGKNGPRNEVFKVRRYAFDSPQIAQLFSSLEESSRPTVDREPYGCRPVPLRRAQDRGTLWERTRGLSRNRRLTPSALPIRTAGLHHPFGPGEGSPRTIAKRYRGGGTCS